MNLFRQAMLAAVVSTAVPGFSQTQAPPLARSDLQNGRALAIVGVAVENRDGEKLATVKDFIVEPDSGEVKYAVLSTAGILGLRAQTMAVPLQALSTATVKRHTLALDIGKAKWKNAPRFRKKDLPRLSERTRQVEIYEFYGLPVPAHKPGHGPASQPNNVLRFASTLFGKDVINYQDETLGKVSDLLVDLAAQRPAFAIITIGDPLRRKETYTIQLRSLNRTRGGKIVLDATRATFEQARPFTPKTWQSASGSSAGTVYRYQ